MNTNDANLCEGPHAFRQIRAWLCVTNKDEPKTHHHVCGTHAHPYRMSRAPYVFRTIRVYGEGEPAPRYDWLDGYGCVSTAQP